MIVQETLPNTKLKSSEQGVIQSELVPGSYSESFGFENNTAITKLDSGPGVLSRLRIRVVCHCIGVFGNAVSSLH